MKKSAKYPLFFWLLMLATASSHGQNVVTRSSEFEVDFSDPNKLVKTTVPIINWLVPVPETSYVQSAKYKIKFEVISTSPISEVTINVKQTRETASRGSQTIKPTEAELLHTTVEKNLLLMEGENFLEIVAINT